jgi:hypothetical protein
VPSTDTSSPRTRQRRSRERRSGDRSMSTRRAVRRSVPSPNVASSRVGVPAPWLSGTDHGDPGGADHGDPGGAGPGDPGGAGPGGPAEPVTATRRRHHQTARAERPAKGRCAPRAAASLADHYHSAAEHGIIGRRIETIVAGRFRRRHPGLWRAKCLRAPCHAAAQRTEPGGRGWENGGDEAADGRRSA